ncbi:MAG: TolC family protein [Magnetococcus sp. MYC-9]
MPPRHRVPLWVGCTLGLLWLLGARISLGEVASPQAFWVAVDNAQGRSPTLQRQAAALRAARETEPQNLSKLLPTVNLSASKTVDETTRHLTSRTASSNEPTQIGLSVTQPLFNYASLLGRKQSVPHIDAAVADLDFAQQELVVRVATLTSNWLEARETYELSENFARVTARHAQVVALRFKAGESAETEVHEAESRAAQAEASRATARNTLEKAAAGYAEVVGEYPTARLALPEFRWQEPPQFETRLAEHVEARADIRAARARSQEADLATKIRQAEQLPTVRFTYTASHTWDSEQGGLSGISRKEEQESQNSMVLLDVPVFNGGAMASRTRQAQAEWEGRVADVDRLRMLAVREAQEARMDIAHLQSAIVAQEKALRASQRALEGLQESFLAGIRTILELLDAQSETLTIQTGLVRSRFQYRLARIRLWAALGWPLVPEHALTVVAEKKTMAETPTVVSAPARMEPSPSLWPAAPARVDPAPPPQKGRPAAPVSLPAGTRQRLYGEAPTAQPTRSATAQGTESTWVVDPPAVATLPPAARGGTATPAPAAPPVQVAWQVESFPNGSRPLTPSSGQPASALAPAAEQTADAQPPQAPLPVAAQTLPVVPESGRRPELPLPNQAPGDRAAEPALSSLWSVFAEAPLPRMGQGPFYVCVGLYPDVASSDSLSKVLAAHGAATLLERVHTQDNRQVMRLLVGPFADFSDLAQARRLVDGWAGVTSGWVRNRAWSPALHAHAGLVVVDPPSEQGEGAQIGKGPPVPAFAPSGPFAAGIPQPAPPLTEQGPLYPHRAEGPFYLHVGAFLSEEERDRVRQQLHQLQITNQRDVVISPEGRTIHRLLVGPFASYDASLQARRTIQKETGIVTGTADNPRWEEQQGCPNEALLH